MQHKITKQQRSHDPFKHVLKASDSL